MHISKHMIQRLFRSDAGPLLTASALYACLLVGVGASDGVDCLSGQTCVAKGETITGSCTGGATDCSGSKTDTMYDGCYWCQSANGAEGKYCAALKTAADCNKKARTGTCSWDGSSCDVQSWPQWPVFSKYAGGSTCDDTATCP